jgi:hypothetical protein
MFHARSTRAGTKTGIVNGDDYPCTGGAIESDYYFFTVPLPEL